METKNKPATLEVLKLVKDDLESKIPSKTSELTNDSEYAKTSDIRTYTAGDNITIDSNDKIYATVPTKLSELTNDSNYAKTSDIKIYTAGNNITISEDNVISSTGGGGESSDPSDVVQASMDLGLFDDILASGNTVYTEDGKVWVI